MKKKNYKKQRGVTIIALTVTIFEVTMDDVIYVGNKGESGDNTGGE